MKTFIILSLLGLSISARAQERFTAEQRAALFYYDLGPKEIDVTSYPKEQQENYKAFAKACSQCHTLARPINSPLITREDWRRYTRRMHAKAKISTNAVIGAAAAKQEIEFLTYDAQVRKVKEAAGFSAKTAELKALFAEAGKERSRIQAETDQKHIQEPAPYMGGR